MARYLDPKNDLIFKRIFGEHPNLLKSFLNALMPLKAGQQIESLEYLPAEQVPDNPAKKNSIVDVRCIDNYGRQFIVEMQMLWNSSFSNRLVFNASKAYVRQLEKSQRYHLLQPVYALAILDSVFDKQTAEFYHHYRIVNDRNTEEVIEGLEFVLVELPKFRAETWTERRLAVLWLRFLREVEEQQSVVSDDLKSDAEIRQALELCEVGAYTNAELAVYDAYWDAIRVENSLIYEGIIEGEAKGEAKGIAKGRAEGRAEGIAEGEAKKLINIVLNCKRNSFSIEQMQAITGLGEEELQEILRSIESTL
ncbi:MAG: Rpn family recombination-promoting nuclease/putative transposase [Tannerella sp.]|jgi:predicted transposase/invertase (TIGR01784 family)|nr:Rpn family recombination-promoting nuclease/putative transposase [Tannerella sp.]